MPAHRFAVQEQRGDGLAELPDELATRLGLALVVATTVSPGAATASGIWAAVARASIDAAIIIPANTKVSRGVLIGTSSSGTLLPLLE